MKFKQSPVVFNEENHTYQLGNKQLIGITGLIHSVLGLGVYPDADVYTKENVIPRAGSRGTAVHHAIQTYDELGVLAPMQTVHTRYGSRERDNIRYVDESWDVSAELAAYIHHKRGFKALANELTVSDNVRYASQIDNVWLREKTGGIWLVDTKTNNIALYPLCGYFNPAYFHCGEDALKEYLSWQLSIYAELFERENPGLSVEGLACNWLRKDTAALWTIERKPSALVWALLATEYVIGDNGPMFFNPDLSVFGIELAPAKEIEAPVDQELIDEVASLMKQHKEIGEKLDDAKGRLRAVMESKGLKSYDFGPFNATITADSTSTAFDAKRFKEADPDTYAKFTKQQTRKGSITIKQHD